jgi:hypothetical protein
VARLVLAGSGVVPGSLARAVPHSSPSRGYFAARDSRAPGEGGGGGLYGSSASSDLLALTILASLGPPELYAASAAGVGSRHPATGSRWAPLTVLSPPPWPSC